MRFLRHVAVLSVAMCCGTTAFAQYGLYGSPEMVPLQPGAAAPGSRGYAAPPVYQTAPPVYPAMQRAPVLPAYATMTPGAPTQDVTMPPSLPAPPPLPAPPSLPVPPPPMPAPPSLPAPPPVSAPGNLQPMPMNVGPAPAAGSPGPSVVEQMLRESAYSDPAPERLVGPADAASGYSPAGAYASGSECGSECLAPGVCQSCGQGLPGCSPWYVSGKVLFMGRNQANKLWTTYTSPPPPTNEALQIPTTFDFEWKWGGEIRLGRKFCCGCEMWGLEATYWTLGEFEGAVTRSRPGGVSTTLTVGMVNFNGNPSPDPAIGIGGTVWFDGALEHRVWRRSEVHNVELNLIHFAQPNLCAGPWSADWSAGVRYFRFEDDLLFSTEANPVNLPDPTLDPNAFLDEQITNSLMGGQFGCNVGYAFSPTWRLFLTPKFGIYNNHINQYFNAGLSDGTIAVPNSNSGQTGTYPVHSSTNVVSFLTQIDLGVQWQFHPNWTLDGGYRVVAATGMGLADDQIPNPVVAIDELADIDNNATLILHGAFVGMTYNY